MVETKAYFQRMIWLQNAGGKIRKGFYYDANLNLFSDNEDCPVRRRNGLFISANGDCYPCGFLEEIPKMRLGNVLRDGGLQVVMEKYPTGCETVHGECITCTHYLDKRCFAGCPARIYALCGDLQGREYYCMKRYAEAE